MRAPGTTSRIMQRCLRTGVVTLLASAIALHPARAQSAQPFSIQLAALFTGFDNGGDNIGGVGVEPQFRFNKLYTAEGFGALSLGIGGQFTSHSKGDDRLNISGLFFEPRYVPAQLDMGRAGLYLSARVAFLRQTNNFNSPETSGSGYGAGGGLTIGLTELINLDAGVQLVRQKFESLSAFTTYTAKVGFSVGFPKSR